jgi:hypothetical protein
MPAASRDELARSIGGLPLVGVGAGLFAVVDVFRSP